MDFERYSLPDGRIVNVDATASRGQFIIGFTMADGHVVDALLIRPCAFCGAERDDVYACPRCGWKVGS